MATITMELEELESLKKEVKEDTENKFKADIEKIKEENEAMRRKIKEVLEGISKFQAELKEILEPVKDDLEENKGE